MFIYPSVFNLKLILSLSSRELWNDICLMVDAVTCGELRLRKRGNWSAWKNQLIILSVKQQKFIVRSEPTFIQLLTVFSCHSFRAESIFKVIFLFFIFQPSGPEIHQANC